MHRPRDNAVGSLFLYDMTMASLQTVALLSEPQRPVRLCMCFARNGDVSKIAAK